MVDLRHDAFGGFRDKRVEEIRANADAFDEVIEHGAEDGLFVFVLGERPRHGFVDILIEAAEHRHDLVGRVGGVERLKGFGRSFVAVLDGADEVFVKFRGFRRGGQDAVEVLIDHGDGTVDEVAEGIDEVGVDLINEHFVGDAAVVQEGHFGEDVIAHRVGAEKVGKVVGVHDVAAGFGHFIHAGKQPRMTENLFRQRFAERHEDDRPVYGMEAEDVLADDLQIGRPVFPVQLALFVDGVAERRDIVGQRVDPDVDDVAGIEFHRYAPLEGGTADAEVLHAGFDEVIDHFLLAGFRGDEVGVGFDIVLKTLLILGQLEKIGGLFCASDGAAAVGAFAVGGLRFRPEGFAGRAVPAFVLAFIDVALIV